MVFPEHGSIIAVQAQYFSDRGRTFGYGVGITWKASRQIWHRAGAYSMRITSGQQSGACGRTHSGCMEPIIFNAMRSQAIQIRRRDWPAKCRRSTKPYIIGHDQQHVWSPLRCFHWIWKRCHGIFVCKSNLTCEGCVCPRQNFFRPIVRWRFCYCRAGQAPQEE